MKQIIRNFRGWWQRLRMPNTTSMIEGLPTYLTEKGLEDYKRKFGQNSNFFKEANDKYLAYRKLLGRFIWRGSLNKVELGVFKKLVGEGRDLYKYVEEISLRRIENKT